MLIPLWIKWTAVGLVVAAIASGAYYVRDLQADNKELRAAQESMLARITESETKAANLDKIFVKRDELHQDIRNGVADVTVRIKQEAANDPKTRDFLSAPLPRGLRDGILKAAAEAAGKHTGANTADTNRRDLQH